MKFSGERNIEGEQKKYTDVFKSEGFKELNKLFIIKFSLKWENLIINNLF